MSTPNAIDFPICEHCMGAKEEDLQHGKCQECIDHLDSISNCCSAGYDRDYGICTECKEHCCSAWDDDLIEAIGFDEWYKQKGSK